MTDRDRYSGGVLAVSGNAQPETRAIRTALHRAGVDGPVLERRGDVTVAVWGKLVTHQACQVPMVLSGLARGPHGDIPAAQLDLASGTAGTHSIADLMPPFGAVHVTQNTVRAVTDALGYRHIYHRDGPGWSALSTSSIALAHLTPARLDTEGIAVQAMLGWQLGDRTLFDGVTKLRQGERITLDHGHATTDRYMPDACRDRMATDQAVLRASTLLRNYLVGYLDEHPDAILQLTGGLDSRILLAAIPQERRRGLRVLTLVTEPNAPDLRIATRLAERYGMQHLVQGLSQLEHLEPAAAHEFVMSAARDLDGMADPVAHAALLTVEETFPQGDRISGLGGEVARGFYYVGPAIEYPVLRPLTRALAGWRMFANDAVTSDALDPEFAQWARRFTTDEIHRVLIRSGKSWPEATDELYLYERMQRWAGVTDSAVCFDRAIVNPMLDPKFIAIANSLRPADRAHASFLTQLVCQLDPELAEIPLDGRRAPAAYAAPGPRQRLTNMLPLAQKARHKILQRLRNERRPPAGGDILAARISEHWRHKPELIESVRTTGIFDADWLDRMLAGQAVDPSTTALLATLVALAPERALS